MSYYTRTVRYPPNSADATIVEARGEYIVMVDGAEVARVRSYDSALAAIEKLETAALAEAS